MRLAPSTRRRIRTRQVLLFVLAIGLPCLVLVALSLRMLAQERELADKRLADERRRMAADARQDLLSRLERLRLQAASGAAADPIALVADGDGDRLVLPWDAQPRTSAAAADNPAFAVAVRDGEREELAARRFDAAAAAYRRALDAARRPVQTAFAQLLLARALAKGGRNAEAGRLYRTLLATSLSLADEHGIPFALYAARRLLDRQEADGSSRTAVLDLVRAALAVEPRLPPPAVYMLNDLVSVAAEPAGAPTDDKARALQLAIAAAARDVEQALALQQAFPTLVARFATGAGLPPEPVWIPFGEQDVLWLVGLQQGQRVLAVRAGLLLAARAAASDMQAHIGVDAGGEPLGPQLPGLALTFPAGANAPDGAATLQRSFYLAALVLVVSMTLLGAYLFWRDVQREVRLADMRSQFVSSVSHELKTPLTAIRMFAETLLLGRAGRAETREEYLETIVNESERLTRLLNNVLDFSKIEQGKKLYRLEPHSLGIIARAAARTMQYPLSQQGFELRVSIDEDLPAAAADADAIEQAILNLLSNAMKYSGDSRTIDLQVRRDGDRAVIAVTDRGLGIPAHEHARIFEKFYRVAGTDRERIPGTGLGLTLVDHVARAHGGEVSVRSVPGEGSTFSIVIPLARAAAAASAPTEALA